MKNIGLVGLVVGITMALFATTSSAGSSSPRHYIKVEVGKTLPMSIKRQPNLVLVGNPRIADIILEENNRIFLVGLAPGETNLLMYDAAGKLMMSRNIVVTRQKTRHVIVHRGSGENTVSCTNEVCSKVPTAQGAGMRGSSAGKTAGGGGTAGQPPELVGE